MARPEEAHDVLGTYRLVADDAEMPRRSQQGTRHERRSVVGPSTIAIAVVLRQGVALYRRRGMRALGESKSTFRGVVMQNHLVTRGAVETG